VTGPAVPPAPLLQPKSLNPGSFSMAENAWVNVRDDVTAERVPDQRFTALASVPSLAGPDGYLPRARSLAASIFQ
jgi:hypothetical protein